MSEQKSAKDESMNGPSNPTNQIVDVFGKLQPYMETLVNLCSQLAPYIDICKTYMDIGWKKVEPYYKQYWKSEYIQIFIGLVLLFFGGMYAMTIACYMAVQVSGLETMKKSWRIVKKNYNEGMESFKKDEKAQKFFDKDGDGSVSLGEIASAIQLLVSGTAQQKSAVMSNLRCVFVVIDPKEVMSGMGGLWATAVAVIATLRSAFAKDVALGVSIGEIVNKQIGKYAKPFLQKRFDDDMKKWADFIIDTVCRFFGVTLALVLVRVTSAFHSAIKGGQIIAKHVFAFLDNKQLYSAPQINTVNIEGSTVFMVVQYTLAAIGFWWQLSSGFALNSFVLRLVLLPFSFVEVILAYLAAY